ncbi:oxysterol-binding protein 2-like [Scyliorhinus torazame]
MPPQVCTYSYFSRDVARKVTGLVTDNTGKAHFILSGTWDEKMDYSRVLHSSKGENSAEGRQKTVYETLRGKELWKRHKSPDHADTMYYFSELALTLNELEEGVAPTDSRMRPDQRMMENGRWDEANMEKQRLEEKQRSVRRKRESDSSRISEGTTQMELSYRPLWFEKREDPYTKEMVHLYKGGYWEAKEKQDWGVCPDIF